MINGVSVSSVEPAPCEPRNVIPKFYFHAILSKNLRRNRYPNLSFRDPMWKCREFCHHCKIFLLALQPQVQCDQRLLHLRGIRCRNSKIIKVLLKTLWLSHDLIWTYSEFGLCACPVLSTPNMCKKIKSLSCIGRECFATRFLSWSKTHVSNL